MHLCSDPFGKFKGQDNELKQVLVKAELGTLVEKLDDKVEEGGSNFSVGERQVDRVAAAIAAVTGLTTQHAPSLLRQLICMARVLLRKPRYVAPLRAVMRPWSDNLIT